MSYECQGDYKQRMEIQRINRDRFKKINDTLDEIKIMMNDLKTIKQDIIIIKELVKKKEERDINKWGIWWQ